MRIGPGMSSQIARAYGLGPARAPGRPVAAPASGEAAGGGVLPAPVSRLVGAVVPGKVSFAGETPMPDGALALYRHPADKNAAATGVHAGRTLDITA
jgi:hypothetical protein